MASWRGVGIVPEPEFRGVGDDWWQWYWVHGEGAQQITESRADYAAGRFQRFDNVDDFIASLGSEGTDG